MLKPVPWPCCARVGVPRNSAAVSAKNETMIMRFIGTSQLISNPKADCLTHSDDTARRSKVHVPKHVNFCRLIITKRFVSGTIHVPTLESLTLNELPEYFGPIMGLNPSSLGEAMSHISILVSLILLFASLAGAKDKKKAVLPAEILKAQTVLVVINPEAGEPLTDPTANRRAQEDV